MRGDLDAVTADFCEALRPQVPQIAQILPQPVTTADVLSAEGGADESLAMIRYSGDSGSVTVRSLWRDEGGRPVIFDAAPAA